MVWVWHLIFFHDRWMVCLRSAYFAETKIFFVENTVDKSKS